MHVTSICLSGRRLEISSCVMLSNTSRHYTFVTLLLYCVIMVMRICSVGCLSVVRYAFKWVAWLHLNCRPGIYVLHVGRHVTSVLWFAVLNVMNKYTIYALYSLSFCKLTLKTQCQSEWKKCKRTAFPQILRKTLVYLVMWPWSCNVCLLLSFVWLYVSACLVCEIILK